MLMLLAIASGLFGPSGFFGGEVLFSGSELFSFDSSGLSGEITHPEIAIIKKLIAAPMVKVLLVPPFCCRGKILFPSFSLVMRSWFT